MGKNKIASQKLSLEQLKEQNRVTEKANKEAEDKEKAFMKDIYRPIIESLNGNLSDQRLVNSFLELNENGTSFYQQFLNDGVPEKNIKKYKTEDVLRSELGLNRLEKIDIVADLEFFRNKDNPENLRIETLDRARKRRQNGTITQQEWEKYFVIAKANNMASLGYGKEKTTPGENPISRASISTAYNKVSILGNKFSDDYSTTSGNVQRFNQKSSFKYNKQVTSFVNNTIPSLSNGSEAKEIANYATFLDAFKNDRTDKANNFLTDAAIGGRVKELMQSELGGLELEKKSTIGIIGGLAIEAIPDLAMYDTPKDLSNALSATDVNNNLTKEAIRLNGLLTDKLEEVLGDQKYWKTYLNDDYSKFRLIK